MNGDVSFHYGVGERGEEEKSLLVCEYGWSLDKPHFNLQLIESLSPPENRADVNIITQ